MTLHIRKLAIDKFATHKGTVLDLPERGLIAITGTNGAGKSSLIEAVATGLWGESLRGELGWRAGEVGTLSVTTDALSVTRKRSKAGSAKLEWAQLGAQPVSYETTTKAQTALEAQIGAFDVWRRTCVLSSLDSAAFSLARDADRKRLLEDFLGLGMFDSALLACRADLKRATAAHADARNNHARMATALEFTAHALEQARKDRADLVEAQGGRTVDSIRADLARVEALLKGAARDARAAQVRVQELQQAGAATAAQAAAEQQRLSRLRGDACPSCGQAVTGLKAHIATEIAAIQARAESERQSVAGALQQAKDDSDELVQEEAALVTRRTTLQGDLRFAEAQARAQAGADSRVAQAEQAHAEASTKAAASSKTVAESASAQAHYEAVEAVLGLRGVRAQVLDKALGALEQATNAWLARMPTEAGPLCVTIAGSTTQKTGSTVDAISLRVGERAYASCSGGERRRVDVAILLALRELAVAAHGRDGTIFADEVFDALDAPGCQDVSSALKSMAEDRLVVVVTHSPTLLATLQPDARLHVSIADDRAAVAQTR